MTFSKEQVDFLKQPIDPKAVSSREQGGMQLSYLESWYVINEANRIFGFDGWWSETVQLDCVHSDEFLVTYIAKVKITVGNVIREGVGAGHGRGQNVKQGDKHESAVKEAESDARKRALMQFGSQFGLSLYDGKKKWKTAKRDRSAEQVQNLAVVAKDAILKATTRAKLDQCAEYLDKRYDENQIPREDYNSLSDLIKNRQEVIKT